MRRLLLSFLLIPAPYAIHAQDWCHAGAVWHYHAVAMGGEGIERYTYTKDTIVGDIACHQLAHWEISDAYLGDHHYRIDSAVQSPLYTYSSNDTVYFLRDFFAKWLPVYYFNAKAGDTISIPDYPMHANSDSLVHALVDSTGSMLINSHQLRYYTFHIIEIFGRDLPFHGKVIERLGMADNDMMPFWSCGTDTPGYSLCSYRDDSFTVFPAAACPSLPAGIKLKEGY